MNVGSLLSITSCTFFAFVTGVSAQVPARHKGIWASLGVGPGWGNATCDNCTGGSSLSGTAGRASIGWAFNPFLRVGAAIDGWFHQASGAREFMADATVSVSYYPFSYSELSNGLFFWGALGAARYNGNLPSPVRGNGPAREIGVGYDLRLHGSLSLTPQLSYAKGNIGDLTLENTGGLLATGWSQTVVLLTLGVTLR